MFSLHAAANPNFKSWYKVHSATEALKKKAAALEPKFHARARPSPDFFENIAERKVNKTRKMKTVLVVKKSKIRFPPLILVYQLCSLRPCLQACKESVEIDTGAIHPKKDTHSRKRARARLGKYALKLHDHEADVLHDQCNEGNGDGKDDREQDENREVEKEAEKKAAEKKAVEKAMAVTEMVRKEAAEEKAAETKVAAEATASRGTRDRAYLEGAYAERAVRENAVEEAKEARKTGESKKDSETVDLTSQHQDEMKDMRVDHDRALSRLQDRIDGLEAGATSQHLPS
ncbi:unnamed protein product [Zymoseptoria tritici ST99CH_3D1]|nr:unnamed protein product [Zymoseptoria tritici ST99CH_3D1]